MHWSQVPGYYNEMPDWVRLDVERVLAEMNDQLRASGVLPEGCRIVWDDGNSRVGTDAVAGTGRPDEGEEDSGE